MATRRSFPPSMNRTVRSTIHAKILRNCRCTLVFHRLSRSASHVSCLRLPYFPLVTFTFSTALAFQPKDVGTSSTKSKVLAKTGHSKRQWDILAESGIPTEDIHKFAEPINWLRSDTSFSVLIKKTSLPFLLVHFFNALPWEERTIWGRMVQVSAEI